MRPHLAESTTPLVLFTVFAQAAAGVGALGLLLPGETLRPLAPALALGLLGLGGLAARGHLHRPGAAPLSLANLRSSWLSREILLGLAFAFALVAGLVLESTPLRLGLGILASLLALAFVYAIASVYRLRTVPAWDSWTTPASFLGTGLVLGCVSCALLLSRQGDHPVVPWLAGLGAVGAAAGLLVATRDTKWAERRGHAGLVATRAITCMTGAVMLLTVVPMPPDAWRTGLLGTATVVLLASELLGRRLFYASHRRVGL